MKRLMTLLPALLAASCLLFVPDRIARSAPDVQTYTMVTTTCSRPVIDVATGQPVFIGGLPWYAEQGENILSHEWQGMPRYEYGGRRYHYIGAVAGPSRFFLVEDCQQPPAPAAAAPPPQVTRVADDVYVFTHTGYTTMFIVTSEGVIVGDPIGNNRASLLKAAIEEVTTLPVKYVVYSHHDADHNTGAAVFRETATFVSHALARDRIAARNDPNSPVPDITFEDRMTLRLGGRQFELYYFGRNHSDSSIVFHYPARRVIFAVDFIPTNSVPFGTRNQDYIAEWIESLRSVEAIDFDTVIPGHGDPGPKDTARQVREYFEDLVLAIQDAEARGLAARSPQMIGAVRAALYGKYGSWAGFGPSLPGNIAGMYEYWDRMGRFPLVR